MELETAIFQIMEHCAPKSILCIGAAAERAAEKWQAQPAGIRVRSVEPPFATDELPTDETFDLAVVGDCLEAMSKADCELLLGQLRNFVASRIVVHTEEGRSPMAFADFIGLGFKRWDVAGEKQETGHIYTYDIASYNHKRQWNSPENWANPENWDKYRW